MAAASSITVQSVKGYQQKPIFNYLDNARDIIRYDLQNDYPQRTIRILNASSTGVACRNMLVKFLVGKGFEDQNFGKAIVNHKDQSASALLRLAAKDFANHNFFGIHVNYNLKYEVTSIQRIDPQYLRLGLPDSNEFSPKIAIHPNWILDNLTLIDRRLDTQPDLIDVFNSNPDVVQAQIEEAGGINNWNGQIFVYWGDEQTYPLARYDALLMDLITDVKISENKLRRLEKGFLVKQAFVFKGVLSETQRKAIKAQLLAAQGTDGDDILLIDGVGDDGLDMVPFNHTFSDADNQYTEESVRKSILRGFNQPAILHSEERQGAMGGDSGQLLENAYGFYNQYTLDDRRIIQESFEKIFSVFKYDVNPQKNFQIIPIDFKTSAEADENNDANNNSDNKPGGLDADKEDTIDTEL